MMVELAAVAGVAAFSSWLWRRGKGASRSEMESVEGRWQRRCGRCGTGVLQKARTRGIIGPSRTHDGFVRFYRCSTCGWRGWLEVVELPRDPVTERLAEPKLEALDEPGFGAMPQTDGPPAAGVSIRRERTRTRQGRSGSKRMRSGRR